MKEKVASIIENSKGKYKCVEHEVSQNQIGINNATAKMGSYERNRCNMHS